MKTTIQILSDKAFFDGFPSADEVLNDFLFLTRRRADLEENKLCYSKVKLLIIK